MAELAYIVIITTVAQIVQRLLVRGRPCTPLVNYCIANDALVHSYQTYSKRCYYDFIILTA